MSGYQLFVDGKRLGEALSPSTLESRLKVRTILVLPNIFHSKIKGFYEASHQCNFTVAYKPWANLLKWLC